MLWTGRLKSALDLVRYAEEAVVRLGRARDGVGGAGWSRGNRVPATWIREVVAELQGAGISDMPDAVLTIDQEIEARVH